MLDDIAAFAEKFSSLRAVVIGDAMLDRYSTGRIERICPEAPVPVIDACSTLSFAGAAANTAINLRALGAQVTFISAVGDDADGELLLSLLQEHDVRTNYVQRINRRCTLSKHRVMAGRQMLLRFDHGTTAP